MQALIVLLYWNLMQIFFYQCEHFCKWTARMVPLNTPVVAILYILTSCTCFRSWSFYQYRKHFGDLDHCFPGPSVKTDDRWNRENKEFRIYQLKYYTWFSIEETYWSIIMQNKLKILWGRFWLSCLGPLFFLFLW